MLILLLRCFTSSNFYNKAYLCELDANFYQRQTLAKKLDLKFASANGIHILSKVGVNEQLLRMATNRFISRLAPWWIRRQLGSKTMTDHQLMLQNLS